MDSDIDSCYSWDPCLRPTIKEAKWVIHAICGHIKEEFQKEFKEFKTHNITKVGSLGSGTAVQGFFDINLVIDFMASDEENYLNDADRFKNQLKEFLKNLSSVINLRESTRKIDSVEFKFVIDESESIGVDLCISPYWEEASEFYEFLMEIKKMDRDRYIMYAAKWQKSFLRQQPQIVKEYVRRAKAWRNSVWEEGTEGRPNSYLIQLLVIKAFQRTQFHRRDKPLKKAERVTYSLKRLVKDERLNVCWDKCCNFYQRRNYIVLLPSRPRIIDPANPANNVWKTGFTDGNPSRLIEMIDSIDLTKPVEYYL